MDILDNISKCLDSIYENWKNNISMSNRNCDPYKLALDNLDMYENEIAKLCQFEVDLCAEVVNRNKILISNVMDFMSATKELTDVIELLAEGQYPNDHPLKEFIDYRLKRIISSIKKILKDLKNAKYDWTSTILL